MCILNQENQLTNLANGVHLMISFVSCLRVVFARRCSDVMPAVCSCLALLLLSCGTSTNSHKSLLTPNCKHVSNSRTKTDKLRHPRQLQKTPTIPMEKVTSHWHLYAAILLQTTRTASRERSRIARNYSY